MTKKQLKHEVFAMAFTIICILIFGAILFHMIEGWSYIDAFYFVTMTATTVGYGDFTPTHNLSKIITIIYALSIVPFVLYAFSFIAKAQVNRVYDKVRHIEHKQKEQENEITEHDKELEVVEDVMEKELIK